MLPHTSGWIGNEVIIELMREQGLSPKIARNGNLAQDTVNGRKTWKERNKYYLEHAHKLEGGNLQQIHSLLLCNLALSVTVTQLNKENCSTDMDPSSVLMVPEPYLGTTYPWWTTSLSHSLSIPFHLLWCFFQVRIAYCRKLSNLIPSCEVPAVYNLCCRKIYYEMKTDYIMYSDFGVYLYLVLQIFWENNFDVQFLCLGQPSLWKVSLPEEEDMELFIFKTTPPTPISVTLHSYETCEKNNLFVYTEVYRCTLGHKMGDTLKKLVFSLWIFRIWDCNHLVLLLFMYLYLKLGTL
jgi:hypothetical protein